MSPPQPHRGRQKTYHRRATHLGLKPPLKHLLGGELKHEVELLLVLAEETEPRHAAKQRGALEQTLGVLRVEGKELTGSLPGVGRDANRRAKRDGFCNGSCILGSTYSSHYTTGQTPAKYSTAKPDRITILRYSLS